MQPLQKFLDLLRRTTPATRIALVVSGLVLASLVGIVGFEATRPHFVPLRAGLDDAQRAAVESALAQGGVEFEVSPYPGPYTVYVDEGELYQAQNLVALSGALAPAAEGIPTGAAGASSVWQTTVERLQSARKREWQECEKQLEVLEHVRSATVTGSLPERAPFQKPEPPTVSVSLELNAGATLDPDLGRTVAKIVQYRFNTPPENIVVVDQHGRLLFDGSSREGEDPDADQLLDHKRRYDQQKAALANAQLRDMFGPGMARVTVDSEWSFDKIESIKETVDPDSKAVVSERTTSSKKPAGSASQVGGTPGGSAPQGGGASAAVAQESESEKELAVGRETEHKISYAPKLIRMSVALAVDESLKDRLPQLEEWVRAAVHFDAARGDQFHSFSAPFATIERDEQGNPIPPKETVVESPNPALEFLLEHGLELAAAGAFLFILLRSLKGARTAIENPPVPAGAAAGPAEEVDPEALARATVEQLIQSDPARVGEILSRWAREEAASAGSAR